MSRSGYKDRKGAYRTVESPEEENTHCRSGEWMSARTDPVWPCNDAV
jgi:hypothetical protein